MSLLTGGADQRKMICAIQKMQRYFEIISQIINNVQYIYWNDIEFMESVLYGIVGK